PNSLFPIPYSLFPAAYTALIYTDMLTLKPKHLTSVMFLVLGLGYFSAMSNLEVNYFLKSLIALMPIQVGAIIYITYLRWSRR
ncbi:hypothetical protein, partial [uncultured Nostoc sp.]|uniref:hypothetical protein n=1 Tax=uncultured Nostoc sp. TaxID=340711 RepID=UPI0035CADE75